MKTLVGILMIVAGMAFAGVAVAQTAPSTAPATTTSKPATPECSGDKCKAMGAGCCKTDDKGKTTCAMGGSCCVKK